MGDCLFERERRFMKCVDAKDFGAWCPNTELKLSSRGGLYYKKHPYGLRLNMNNDRHQALYIASHISSFNPDSAAVGIIVKETGIWSEEVESVGLYLLRILRASCAEDRPLQESRLHLFEPNEIVQANALLSLILLVGWEGYYTPQNGKYFVNLSHDDVTYVVSEDKDLIESWRGHWGASEVVDELPLKVVR
jgi:hypothetical protein